MKTFTSYDRMFTMENITGILTSVKSNGALARFNLESANTDSVRLHTFDVFICTGRGRNHFGNEWIEILTRHGICWIRSSRLVF